MRGTIAGNPDRGYTWGLLGNQKAAIGVARAGDVQDAGGVTPGGLGPSRFVLTDDWRFSAVNEQGKFNGRLRFENVNPRVLATSLADLADLWDLADAPLNVLTHGVAANATTPDDQSFSLTGAERAALVSGLGANPETVSLVVLDFEWPSYPEAVASTAWLYQLLNTVRQPHSRLAPRALPPVLDLSDGPHSLAIRDALLPLQAVEPSSGKTVDVRYLPMIAVPGADSVLVDLVATYRLLVKMSRLPGSMLAPPDEGRKAMEPLEKESRDEAIVAIGKIPTQSSAAQVEVLRTSRVIFDALQYLLDRRAQLTGTPFVISASWVLADGFGYPPFRSNVMRGLVVAAAGNEDEDVTSPGRDLAQWSATSDYVLTVENFQSTNDRTCRSSFYPPDQRAVAESRVVGFRGGRAPVGPYPCGTSFSAPRVAWLLAARFAQRAAVTSWSGWSAVAWNDIKRASPSLADPRKVHPFSVASLFAGNR